MRRPPARFGCPVAAGAALTLAGCSGPLSTLDPAGPAAGSIAALWWVMLAGAAALFGLVTVLLVAAFAKPGVGAKIPAQVWLTGGGLVLPGIVLTPLLLYALWSGERLLAHPAGEAIRIEAEARQWHWTFTYPDAEGGARTSDAVLHIPTNRTVEVHVSSADVIHSFWVPRLAGKIDAIPGHVNVLRLSAVRPGVYRGVCAEFCGPGHTGMEVTVEALPPEEYAAWLKRRAERRP